MKKYFTLLLFLLAGFAKANAQQQYLTTLSGMAYKEANYSDVKGSPYANEDWATGTVQTSKGVYNNVQIKYSELDDQVYFKGKDQGIMQFADPVKDFTYTYNKGGASLLAHYRNGYQTIPGSKPSDYFEVLADGKTQLLKKVTKKIKQETTYGSTESGKSFMTTVRYYVVTPEKGLLVKKDKKSLLTALGDKQNELEAYSKANNIDFKNDEDLAKLITYYNSI